MKLQGISLWRRSPLFSFAMGIQWSMIAVMLAESFWSSGRPPPFAVRMVVVACLSVSVVLALVATARDKRSAQVGP